MQTQFAAQSWTFRSEISATSICDLLVRLKKSGYEAIEISETGNMALGDFVSAVKDAKLRVSGIHLPCLWGVQKSKGEIRSALKHVFELLPERTPKHPTLLSFMGHPTMLRGSKGLIRERYNHLGDLIRLVRQVFGSHRNIVFGYHMYDFDYLAPSDCINTIVDAGARLVIDTYFANVASVDPIMVAADWKGAVVSAHLNDYDGREHKSLGSGTGNLSRFAEALARKVGQLHSLVVEHEPKSTLGTEMLINSARYVEKCQLLNVYHDNLR